VAPQLCAQLLMHVEIRSGEAAKISSAMDRLQMLKDLLAQDPNNQLARYGLGMEYSNKGEVDAAVKEFRDLLQINPDYANAYFMAAQALAKADRTDEAKHLLMQGITAAARTGNSHAQSEMQAMLDGMEY
jgi:tetratricopeptide (TPR) repeat protein